MLPVLVELMLVLWLALLLWHSKLLLALDSCSCEADPRSRSRGRRKMAAGGCLPLSGVVSLALKCPMEKLPSSLSPVSGYSMVLILGLQPPQLPLAKGAEDAADPVLEWRGEVGLGLARVLEGGAASVAPVLGGLRVTIVEVEGVSLVSAGHQSLLLGADVFE